MMAYWPSLVAAAGALFGVFEPHLNGWIAAHPSWSAAIAGASTILAHFAKSPKSK